MDNCTESQDLDLSLSIDFDLDAFLLDFPDGLDLDSAEESNSPNSALSYKEIERILMEDGDEVLADEFAEGVLVGGVSGSSASESDTGKCEVATPADSVAAEEKGEEREEEGDDPVSKKRRRQLRNRESAMMSRERKKMYVKDLEMKSKYLESECRRLDYALRCCVAENHALHQRLQMGRPFGVSAAKQESAVLFVESLLLGSLFWLLSLVCLSLMPNPKEGSRPGRGLALEAAGSEILANSKNLGTDLRYELVTVSRRCRGTRARMKLDKFRSSSVPKLLFGLFL